MHAKYCACITRIAVKNLICPKEHECPNERHYTVCVRCEKVCNALNWLKENNPLYVDIEINNDLLNSLDDNHILPYHIEHVVPSDKIESLVSRYDEDATLDLN